MWFLQGKGRFPISQQSERKRSTFEKCSNVDSDKVLGTAPKATTLCRNMGKGVGSWLLLPVANVLFSININCYISINIINCCRLAILFSDFSWPPTSNPKSGPALQCCTLAWLGYTDSGQVLLSWLTSWGNSPNSPSFSLFIWEMGTRVIMVIKSHNPKQSVSEPYLLCCLLVKATAK